MTNDIATIEADRIVFDDRFKPISFSDFKLSPPAWLMPYGPIGRASSIPEPSPCSRGAFTAKRCSCYP